MRCGPAGKDHKEDCAAPSVQHLQDRTHARTQGVLHSAIMLPVAGEFDVVLQPTSTLSFSSLANAAAGHLFLLNEALVITYAFWLL